ncbi:MAG: sugar ABC transporter substrate-binding protein [Suipraeoptans sp.]
MKKKCILIFSLSILSLFLVTTIVVTNQRKNSEHLIFGATYMTMNNPYFTALNDSIKEVVESNGDTLITRDPLQDQDKQNQQIKAMIKEGMDVLFLNPVDWKDVRSVVKLCESHNIPVFAVDTNIYDTKDMEAVISTIASDNYNAGVQCAKDMKSKTDSADIVIINHTDINSTNLRVEGFRDTLEGNPNYKVVEYRDSTTELEVAMSEMEDIIHEGKKFDVVLGGNDPTALGCLAAMQKLGYEEPVLIYGIDGSPDAKAMLKAGYMEGTCAQSPNQIGTVAAETAYKYLGGQKVDSNIMIPVNLITKENLKNYDLTEWQ